MQAQKTESSDSAKKVEEYNFRDWTVSCISSHILPSKCSDQCSRESSGSDRCIFCRYSSELDLPHLPEMVFPFNSLEIKHKNGCCIEFNALDALKLVKDVNLSAKIACADKWQKAREETGIMEKPTKEFDWTFKTEYTGTYKNWELRETTEEAIDMNKLRQKEEILLYKNITLFEDELHDNGISLCSVRIRVMPSGFFILLRYFLRVDGVTLNVHDTRIYHDFNCDYLIAEFSRRENSIPELKIPLQIMNEPDEVTPLLTLVSCVCEKLILPKS